MPKTAKTVQPKKVVYLFGAGATQAEFDHIGVTTNILMGNYKDKGDGISTAILKHFAKEWPYPLPAENSVDVEKLVSLLNSSGTRRMETLAESIRSKYVDEIQMRLRATPIISKPILATTLLEFHADEVMKKEVEVLTGLITTNHDGLLQLASMSVHGAINLGIPFQSRTFGTKGKPPSNSLAPPLLLQLHGSFTWKFGRPIKVSAPKDISKYSSTMIWIPPTTSKDARLYPFGKLMALAYEMLCDECDVLRVVGASMTQNDWNILSLIFNAQQHRRLVRKSEFVVELIMPQKSGVNLVATCSFLQRLVPIASLTDGHFSDYAKDEDFHSPEMKSQFRYWLKQKIHHHRGKGQVSDDTMAKKLAPVVGESI